MATNTNKSDFAKLKKKWDEKLKKSGFQDIEFWQSDGQASPFFVGKEKSASHTAAIIDHQKAEYYRLVGIFIERADWSNFKFKACSWKMAKRIYTLWGEGLTGIQIANKLGKVAMTQYKKFLLARRKLRKSPNRYKLRRSGALKKKWFERRVREIDAYMYSWHRFNRDGERYISDF